MGTGDKQVRVQKIHNEEGEGHCPLLCESPGMTLKGKSAWI